MKFVLHKKLVQFRSPPTLRLRLMSLIGAVFLITLIVTGAFVYIYTYRSETAAWRGRQGEAARSAAAIVADFVDKAQSLLAVGFILGNDPLDFQQVADQIITVSPTFMEVIRLDSKGDIQGAASSDKPVLANLFTIPQSQWFHEASAGKSYYGTVQISSQNEPYLILAVPLPDGGVAAGRLRMNILQDVVSNIHFGITGKAYLFNSEGQIIAHTIHNLALDFVTIANRPEFEGVMQAVDHQWYGAYSNLQGEFVVGASAKASGSDWYILTELKQGEAFSSSRNVIWIIGALLVFMVLVMTIVRLILIRSVFLPLEKLKDGALAIGEGKFDQRIGMVRGDEIGILSSAFDEMAAQLGKQRQILEQRATELEIIYQIGLSLTSQLNLKLVLDAVLESIFKLLSQVTYSYIFIEQSGKLEFGASLFADGLKDAIIQRPRSAGLTENVYQTGRFQIANDQAQFPLNSYQDEIRALIGVPLKNNDRVLGVMNVAYTEKHNFSEDEIRLLNLLGNQVAIAIENARLYEEAQQDLLERRKVEMALRESELRYRMIAENTSDVIWVRDMNRNLIYISPAVKRLCGYSQEEAMTQSLDQTFTPASVEIFEQTFSTGINKIHHQTVGEIQPPSLSMEVEAFCKDSSTVWVETVVTFILDEDGNPFQILGVTRDITERRQGQAALQEAYAELEQRVVERTAELSRLNLQLITENQEKSDLYTQVRASLNEKEVLLKEIHHRVKNNLQVISSLLSLQSNKIQDPQSLQLFRDSQNRVKSMALIHEKLYQSNDLARIDMKGYIQSLSSYLVRSYATEIRGVQFRAEVEDVTIGIDQAIPCGLIINELISNALKYAFPNEREGEVNIQLSIDGDQQFHLVIGDNGIGFPENLDFQKTTSLGLQLVNSLVRQLGGTVELNRDCGTQYCITFREPENEHQAMHP